MVRKILDSALPNNATEINNKRINIIWNHTSWKIITVNCAWKIITVKLYAFYKRLSSSKTEYAISLEKGGILIN